MSVNLVPLHHCFHFGLLIFHSWFVVDHFVSQWHLEQCLLGDFFCPVFNSFTSASRLITFLVSSVTILTKISTFFFNFILLISIYLMVIRAFTSKTESLSCGHTFVVPWVPFSTVLWGFTCCRIWKKFFQVLFSTSIVKFSTAKRFVDAH